MTPGAHLDTFINRPVRRSVTRELSSALLLSASAIVVLPALTASEATAQTAAQKEEELKKKQQQRNQAQPQRINPRVDPQLRQQPAQIPNKPVGTAAPIQRNTPPPVAKTPVFQNPAPVVRTAPSTQPPAFKKIDPAQPPVVTRTAPANLPTQRTAPLLPPNATSPPKITAPLQPNNQRVTTPGQGSVPTIPSARNTPAIGVSPTGQFIKPGTPNVGRTLTPTAGPTSITQFQKERVRTTDRNGRQLIQEPGNRTIIVQNNRRIIHRNETSHIQKFYPGARTTPLPNGLSQTSYIRSDGVRVFTETDRAGRIVRRFGRGTGGRDIVYIDNRRFYRNLAIGAGIAAVGVGIALALAPPAIAMPRERYIVDYDRASDDEIYEALSAPPIVRLERGYSLEEIRYTETLRARMRRVDLDSITFDTGSVVITEDQYPKLERIARAMARVIDRDPAETFLIEGHTDAVGEAEDNLSLSDRRAEAVAQVSDRVFLDPTREPCYTRLWRTIPQSRHQRAGAPQSTRRHPAYHAIAQQDRVTATSQ